MNTLRLILGDQLNINHSWFKKTEPHVVYGLMEIRSETDYATHHIQKVVAFFAAMRAFAETLRKAGHRVRYMALDDANNKQSFEGNLALWIAEENCGKIAWQQPDEYRLEAHLNRTLPSLGVLCEVVDSEHFLTQRNDLKKWFEGKKNYLMETFYRKVRQQYGILMDGKDPVGGQWNFDHDNRQAYKGEPALPPIKAFENNVAALLQMIEKAGIKTMGHMQGHYLQWPIDRAQALQWLAQFAKHLLPHFGSYQDAMIKEHWYLFHSRLSFAMNAKIISPLEVVNYCIDEWKENKDKITIAQIEGFVRQIIGWREYMRGVYWAHMPEYATRNFFGHKRKLPSWYWTGHTQCNCLKHAIGQSLEHAYAHHIQRLMITGNFALLAGIDPDEVDAWYLGVYIDAIEWVEITNTRGMSQFADGGLVGTKPYVSSANYIDKMSNYCQGCYYNKKAKTGARACPFNSLYWHFYHRHRPLLERNPRIGMMYRTWDKMHPADQQAILQEAEKHLGNLESL